MGKASLNRFRFLSVLSGHGSCMLALPCMIKIWFDLEGLAFPGIPFSEQLGEEKQKKQDGVMPETQNDGHGRK